MALHLQKTAIQRGLTGAVLALAVAIGAAWFALGWNPLLFAALALLALLVGALIAWLTMRNMAQVMIDAVPVAISYARVKRSQPVNGMRIDWHQFADYAAQLEALGFVRIADVTSWPLTGSVSAVAVIFRDSASSTLVELQAIQSRQPAQENPSDKINGIHFSVFSLLGGYIRVTVTDHTPTAANYLMRSSADVVATCPGQNLMFLLDKHRRLVQSLRDRTGKQVASGVTLARYVMLQRERFLWVRQHLNKLGPYKIIKEFDQFEAKPLSHWAPSSGALAALPVRSLDELDKPQASPLIVDLPDAASVANPVANPAPTQPTQATQVDRAALRQKVSRAASWFYAIAAFSLLTMGAQIINSKWNFALGLGFSQLLGSEAHQLYESGAPGAAIFAMYLGCVGSIAFIAACGWFARKPSVFVFMVGMVVYALDMLIFLIAMDVVGVVIHVVALLFLRRGVPAARVLREGRGG